MLGKKDDERKYADLAKQIEKTFIDKFYDPKTGTFTGEEQCGMAAALYQGLVPSGEKSKVTAALAAEVEKRDYHVWAGILGTKYLLHALTDNGMVELAYKVANQRTWPSWGHWVEQGATSLWESWDGGESLNHIMFGDIDAWFYEALAGINPDPDKPGFKHIIIRPNPVGDITWVKAHHRSLYGLICSSWRLDGDKFSLHINIPANTTATVYIPARSVDQVTESGRPAAEAEGVRFVGIKDGKAVFEAGSGTYEFLIESRYQTCITSC